MPLSLPSTPASQQQRHTFISSMFKLSLLSATIMVATAATSSAASVTYSAFPNTDIPDNNIVGVASSIAVPAGIPAIANLTVTLRIDGGFNGDYYAYLTNGTSLSILLNRSGVTTSALSGSPDAGFNVRFDDGAPAGDIHLAPPVGGQLGGLWAPDGRSVHPSVSTDTAPRTAPLSTFIGAPADGLWTLYVVDASPIGVGRFASWGLEIVTVPEPGVVGLLVAGGTVLFRRRRK